MKRTILYILATILSVCQAYSQKFGETPSDPATIGSTFEQNGLEFYVVDRYPYGLPYKGVDYGGQVVVMGPSSSESRQEIFIPGKVTLSWTDAQGKVRIAIFSVAAINDQAFMNNNVETLRLPTSIGIIGKEAFKGLTVRCGYLIVPQARLTMKNAFADLKASLVFYSMSEDASSFPKTFEDKENLPPIYIRHSDLYNCQEAYGWPAKDIITVGDSIIARWQTRATPKDLIRTEQELVRSKYPSQDSIRRDSIRRGYTVYRPSLNELIDKATNKLTDYEGNNNTSIKKPQQFYTISNKYKTGIRVYYRKIKSKNSDKYGDCRDRFSRTTFLVYNPYLRKTETYSEVEMDESLFRAKKSDEYFYFTMDGKQINAKSLISPDGFDPFGTKVVEDSELEQNKKNTKKIENKLNNMMKEFGF